MHDLRRRKAVEGRTAGPGIGADVFGVQTFAHFQVRKLLRQADGVKGIAGGAEDGTNLRRPPLEAFQGVLGVVKDHAAEGVIYAVIEIVAELSTAESLADDLRD